VRARRRAAVEHAPERGVDGDEEIVFLEPLLQRVRDVQPRRHEHGARIRRPPQHRIAFVEPRKDPVPVCIDEPLQGQRAARREQTIGMIERLLDGRKRVGRPEEGDHAKLDRPLRLGSAAWSGSMSGKALSSGAKLVPLQAVSASSSS
jgi:hypothetical protein